METVVYIKREDGKPVAVRVKCLRQGNDWLAIAEIKTRKGPIRLTATASEEVIKDLVKRGVAKIPPQMVSGADIFSTISNIAKSTAARNVLSQAKSVVTNPMFLQALSFIPGLGPAVNVVQKAQGAAQAAENLMGRARQGDAKAQKSITTIASHAKRGSQKASWLLALLRAADSVKKTFFSGVDVDDVTQFLTAEAGSSWTAPWDSSGSKAPPPSPAPQPTGWPAGWPMMPPPQMPGWSASQPPGGWPAMPPAPSAPPQPPAPQTPAQATPGWPAGQMPPGWSPAPMPPQLPPGAYPQGWPWFPRNTPKC